MAGWRVRSMKCLRFYLGKKIQTRNEEWKAAGLSFHYYKLYSCIESLNWLEVVLVIVIRRFVGLSYKSCIEGGSGVDIF